MKNTYVKIMEERKQVRVFDNNKIPDKTLINEILEKAYKLTPSKQNLMPYKVHVLGPNKENLKNLVYELTMRHEGRSEKDFYKKGNLQIIAPYLLIIELRDPEPTEFIAKMQKQGLNYKCELMPTKYFSYGPAVEAGMFTTVLTGLLVDNGLSISYTGCIPKVTAEQNKFKDSGIDFINNSVFTMLSIGYPDTRFSPGVLYPRHGNRGENKPLYEKVIQWHD